MNSKAYLKQNSEGRKKDSTYYSNQIHFLPPFVKRDCSKVFSYISPTFLIGGTLLMLNWFKKILRTKSKPDLQPHNRIRKNVDTNSIKARINGLGWQIREIPVKRSSPNASERSILHYKIIVCKGERSLEVTGKSLNEAIETIGAQLGVIPRN